MGKISLGEYILSIKPFDSKGSKKSEKLDRRNVSKEIMEQYKCTNSFRINYGSNYWEYSTLREWLNSQHRFVNYSHNIPDAEHVKCNPYSDEQGFLYNFSEAEKELIIPTMHKVLICGFDKDEKDGGNQVHNGGHHVMNYAANYDKAFYKYFIDKVYVPCIYEIREFVRKRGWNVMKLMTPKCYNNAQDTRNVRMKKDNYWHYWLSTPCNDKVEYISCVLGEVCALTPDPSYGDPKDLEIINEARIGFGGAIDGHKGVAPVINISSEVETIDGDGSLQHPWVLKS